MSDNSGKSLSSERVKWRKNAQRIISSVFLILPFIIILCGFLINGLLDTTLADRKWEAFGIPALVIYIGLNIMSLLYFETCSPENIKPDNYFAKFRKQILKVNRVMRLSIGRTPLEKKWCDKLYGIYNDYAFHIRKPANFRGNTWAIQRKFIQEIGPKIKTFPQDKTMMRNKAAVPAQFKLKAGSEGFFKEDEHDERFVWVYYIPNSFYKRLHTQLLIIVAISLTFFLVFSMLNIAAYEKIGSPGLLMFAFACWNGLYLGMLYLDFAVFRKSIANDFWDKVRSSFSIRFLLFVLLIIFSFSNDDHPVRENKHSINDQRPHLREHFTQWAKHYIADTSNAFRKISDVKDTLFYPVTFVCAEGGALRTGAYASMFLSHLQDSLSNRDSLSVDFKKSIYGFSGVSGGALGVSFFHSVGYLNETENLKGENYVETTKRFYSNDFLSAIIGKMFYGDIINLVLPKSVQMFDRAVGLETSWELASNTIISEKGTTFSADFLKSHKESPYHPALFINTTEVESGLQCWITNVKPDSARMFMVEQRDLFHHKLQGGINYSTAVNFSSRFPLFSPAATIIENEGRKRHYVDGGYAENTGTATMHEVLGALVDLIYKEGEDSLYGHPVKLLPNVIVLRFSDESLSRYSNIDFGNEWSEILYGIYNTRAGRVDVSIDELEKFMLKEFGSKNGVISLKLSLTGQQVPMNWMLSNKSLEHIENFIHEVVQENKEMKKMPFFDKRYYRKVAPPEK